jgi:8-amino-7-oxononanoate synthase
MTNEFDSELNQQLDEIREAGLYRELRRIGSAQGPHLNLSDRAVLNFSSNDYLGLANEPAVKQAAIAAVEQFGAGSGASRLVCGSLAPHHELEGALADFKGAEVALSFSSGYAAALGTIGALVGKEDVIVLDKLVHASIVDAARLSGAKLRIFAHNDMGQLEEILNWAGLRGGKGAGPRKQRTLIVTESVFSMDGDLAPLREIVELKERHGAWLMLDEAHATGLFGSKRRGLAEAFELDGAVEIQMGTLGKALGSAGGYICGSRALIDLLVNRARSFVFSTAPAPAAAAAATAAVALVQSEEGEKRRNQLWANVDRVKNGLVGMPWAPGVVRSAILPLIVGEESKAMDLSSALLQCGILIPAIRFPTVPRGSARLRLTLSAAHSANDIANLLESFQHLAQPGLSKQTDGSRA